MGTPPSTPTGPEHPAAATQGEGDVRDVDDQLARGLIGLLPGAAFVCDREGGLVAWNEAAVELWGRVPARGEASRPYCGQLKISPGDPSAPDPMAEVLRTGEPKRDLEVVIEPGDGVRRVALANLSPLRDDEGRVTGVVHSLVDMTRHLQTELALERDEAQLRLVTDFAPVLLVHCDREVRFKFVNKPYAARFGLTPEEVVGRTIPEVIGERAYESFHSYIETTLAGERVEFEVEIPYEQIGPRVMHCTCAPDRGAEGEVRGLVAVLVDVTERNRAERALVESQQRFARFMENLPGLAWIKDAEGRYVYANDYAVKAFSLSREQLYGSADDEIFPPHTASEFRKNDELAMASGAGVQVVEALADEAGEIRYSLVSKFPLHTAEGGAPYVGGMAIDITDSRRAEEEMRHSEERFRSLMEQAPFSIQLFRPDGTTIRVNRAWEELWGFKFEQLAGYNVLEDPQLEAKGVLEYIRRGFAGTPTRVPAIEYNPTETLTHLDAAEDLRRWLSAVVYPIKDADGEVREVALIHEDITARHRAETELELARGRLDAALEAGAIATWTYDVEQNRLAIDKNIVRMFDLPPDTPLDAPLERFTRTIPPEDWPIVERALARALAGEGDYEAEYRHIQDTGRVRWVISRGKVERDEAGRPVRMPGVLFEITERKKLEEELRLRVEQLDEVDRRKDEFLATLAHELRNPLAPICNSLQILSMPRVDPEILQSTREMMERQVHHLVRLVDDLLDVSRVMRGKIELRRERVELASIIARAIETAQPLVDRQGHQLHVDVCDESLLVDADPVRLAQVIGNLLTNAAKYTGPEGNIWLSAHRDGEEGVLRIRDNGIGIDEGTLPSVFELFVQADQSSTMAQGGLGIGLTLVKNLVEMHGGRVEATSGGLGQGSEFVVRLPLATPDAEAPAAPSENRPAEESKPRHRLLVVDDNRDAATTLSMLLRLRGHDVRVAHDGPEALKLAAEFRPALVFLDLGMPGMDGYEVASHLRAMPELEGVVLAALTGWGQQEDRRRTAEAGFDHHLVKPPDPQAIADLLESL